MLICLLIAGLLWREPQEPAGEDSLFVMFWNLENYFDWRSDTFDKKHWTRSKFLRKSQAIAKTILWLEDKNGILPDVIGVAEVENRKVLEILLKETPLRKRDYSIVHYESPDPRGIDVALMYRKSRLKLLFSKPLKVTNKGGPEFSTRDILLSCFLRSDGDSVAFLVNHHPSKYGGPSSSWRRRPRWTALRRRQTLCGLPDSGILSRWGISTTHRNPHQGIQGKWLTLPPQRPPKAREPSNMRANGS